jgi:hypothetical protein
MGKSRPEGKSPRGNTVGEVYRARSLSHSIPDSLIVRYSNTACSTAHEFGRWGRMEGGDDRFGRDVENPYCKAVLKALPSALKAIAPKKSATS